MTATSACLTALTKKVPSRIYQPQPLPIAGPSLGTGHGRSRSTGFPDPTARRNTRTHGRAVVDDENVDGMEATPGDAGMYSQEFIVATAELFAVFFNMSQDSSPVRRSPDAQQRFIHGFGEPLCPIANIDWIGAAGDGRGNVWTTHENCTGKFRNVTAVLHTLAAAAGLPL